VGRPKATATRSTERFESQRTSLAPAVTAFLDHIAEDLAREYVRLMEGAAKADGPEGHPCSDEDQEACDASRDLR
jgi:hypothetical protein